jgi:hypothetical protein
METLGAGAFFDQNIDAIASITQMGNNYKQALNTKDYRERC